MAITKRCDRCGREIKKHTLHCNSVIFARGESSSSYIYGVGLIDSYGDLIDNRCFDLCDDCINAFTQFMNGYLVGGVIKNEY